MFVDKLSSIRVTQRQ